MIKTYCDPDQLIIVGKENHIFSILLDDDDSSETMWTAFEFDRDMFKLIKEEMIFSGPLHNTLCKQEFVFELKQFILCNLETKIKFVCKSKKKECFQETICFPVRVL